MANNAPQIPVYLFTGFLEAGKTKFIQETMEDKRFNAGEKTLLLLCEEGMEEYEPDQFYGKNVKIVTVDEESALTGENLAGWLKEAAADRVVVEYNGMWLLDSLYNALPEGWIVAQEFMFANAATFLSYNANMRQLCYDKLKSCELVVFNRFTADMDKLAFHKIVRGASRRCDIAYEDEAGNVAYDEIEDPLPFDVNAPIIEVADSDYALFYRDVSEDPKKYNGKTVRFLGHALKRKNVAGGSFILGRHVMTCCEADIQFAGYICNWPDAAAMEPDVWVRVTAKMEYKFHIAYGRKGPVLTASSVESAQAPEPSVATFY